MPALCPSALQEMTCLCSFVQADSPTIEALESAATNLLAILVYCSVCCSAHMPIYVLPSAVCIVQITASLSCVHHLILCIEFPGRTVLPVLRKRYS